MCDEREGISVPLLLNEHYYLSSPHYLSLSAITGDFSLRDKHSSTFLIPLGSPPFKGTITCCFVPFLSRLVQVWD